MLPVTVFDGSRTACARARRSGGGGSHDRATSHVRPRISAPLCQVRGLARSPGRECVVVLAGVKADARRVAALALTPAAGADGRRLRGTAFGVLPWSVEVFGLCEEVGGEAVAGVEDFDADEAAVVPVEGDEAVDPVRGIGSGCAVVFSSAVETEIRRFHRSISSGRMRKTPSKTARSRRRQSGASCCRSPVPPITPPAARRCRRGRLRMTS